MAKKRNSAAPSPRQQSALSREAKNEPDPEWRVWFMQVEEKRKRLEKPRGQRYSLVQDDTGSRVVARSPSQPLPIKNLLRKEEKASGRSHPFDREEIGEVWKRAVGMDVASETGIYAFKNGVLTVHVASSSLLQEIRQFHKTAILQDLRDIWSLEVPLLRIVYKLAPLPQ